MTDHLTDAVSSSLGLRKEPKQARSRKRVDAAIAALLEMLTENPDSTPTLAEIAGRIQIPTGSLYEYFEDVSAIADAAVVTMLNRHDELLTQIPIESFSTTEELVNSLFDAYIRLYTEQRGFVMLRQSRLWNERHRQLLIERVEGFLLGASSSLWKKGPNPRASLPTDRLGLVFAAADAMLQKTIRSKRTARPQLAEDARAAVISMLHRIVSAG